MSNQDCTKSSDLWETPKELFDELNGEFNFGIDLCATESNSKVRWFCKDYLTVDFSRDTYAVGIAVRKQAAFMNPPYSNLYPFVKKAWEDSKYCKIVSLLKCDTSTKMWGVFWDYEHHRPKPGCEIRFLPKRVKFNRPCPNHKESVHSDGACCFCYDTGHVDGTAAPFPSVIVVMDRRNIE